MATIPAGTKFIGIGASVPTPENKSSQNNGFQEVYTIEDVLSYDNATSGLTATDYQAAIDELVANPQTGYTETIVNITPLEVEDWYNTRVTLLSGFGANEYPEISHFVVESELTGTETSGDYVAVYSDNGVLFDPLFSIDSTRLFNGNKNVYTVSQSPSIRDASDNALILPIIVGSDIKMASFVGNPTSVTGTLRVKIYHKTITFGA